MYSMCDMVQTGYDNYSTDNLFTLDTFIMSAEHGLTTMHPVGLLPCSSEQH